MKTGPGLFVKVEWKKWLWLLTVERRKQGKKWLWLLKGPDFVLESAPEKKKLGVDLIIPPSIARSREEQILLCAAASKSPTAIITARFFLLRAPHFSAGLPHRSSLNLQIVPAEVFINDGSFSIVFGRSS